MKLFRIVVLFIFLAAVSVPACAQRNASKTSSARAAYGLPAGKSNVKKKTSRKSVSANKSRKNNKRATAVRRK